MAALSVSEQLKQLDDARKLVLGDANYYPQIIQGILPIIGPEARVELRRWGADFLAETFASPSLPAKEKESLSLLILETLKSMIENPNEDLGVVKSVVQTAASIYPLVFRWIIHNGYDRDTWDRMAAIKSRILRIWDTAMPGIRICCVKFAQRVVLVQTAGLSTDTSSRDPLEISLLMVPPNHPLIPPRNLEAEASGLLDRMLGTFHENTSDVVMVDATLNSLSILIRARPPISNKILNAILSFNPLKLANSPMTPKLRVAVKSMEKTTRQLLIHLHKRDPQNPLAPRIHQHIERLMRSRTEIFEEATRKRGPPEPIEGLDNAKRQRLGAEVAMNPRSRLYIPPLTPGSHTIAELFTLSKDAAGFDISDLSADIVLNLGVSILQHVDSDTFNQAINGVRDRYLKLNDSLVDISMLNPDTAPLGVDEDDDDYEPDFEAAEDTEQILNKLDYAPREEQPEKETDVSLGSFTMPAPQTLTLEEVTRAGQTTVSRVFGVIETLEEPPSKKHKTGINRLAASTYDRDAWITVISRLATRAPAGLEVAPNGLKPDPDAAGAPRHISLSDTIRESLYLYIVEHFRRRIDIAVAWLCEEWYNDKIQTKMGRNAIQHYEKWALKVLDGVLPYLDARDKFLTRFLSEIPGLSVEALERVKILCRDPAMVQLALTTLLYLVMMRPPVREIALDAVEDVWRTYDDARPMAAKYLSKWRPGFLEQNQEVKEVPEKKLISNESMQNGASIAT